MVASTVAVIPARLHATRFPGKPLVPILGVPLVVRVAERAARARAVDDVWVATDDATIAEVAERSGFRAVMTRPELESGTDRVAEAVFSEGVKPLTEVRFVLNVQGDEPLVDPDDLDALVRAMARAPTASHTLARSLDPAGDDPADPNLVKVRINADGWARRFTRHPLARAAVHVGVYGFTPATLTRFVAGPPSEAERAERLEPLRALALRIPIRVTMCQSPRPSIGVDVPADVGRVEAALQADARGTN